MTMREFFNLSQSAMENGHRLNLATVRIAQASDEMIRLSRELLSALAEPRPSFKGPDA
jgi:hypothetical protein